MSRHRNDLAAARDRIASLERDVAERDAQIANLRDDPQPDEAPDRPTDAKAPQHSTAASSDAHRGRNEIPAKRSPSNVSPSSLTQAYARRDAFREQARLRCERQLDRINSGFGNRGYDEARAEGQRQEVIGDFHLAQQAAEDELHRYIARGRRRLLLVMALAFVAVLLVAALLLI